MNFKEKLVWYFSERGWFVVTCLFGMAITMVVLNLIIKMIFDLEISLPYIDTINFEIKIKNRILKYALIEIVVFILLYFGLIIKDYFRFFKDKSF